MSEYEEPKFSYPGMKTDAMRVKELSKENSQLHSELDEARNTIEFLQKRMDAAALAGAEAARILGGGK